MSFARDARTRSKKNVFRFDDDKIRIIIVYAAGRGDPSTPVVVRETATAARAYTSRFFTVHTTDVGNFSKNAESHARVENII